MAGVFLALGVILAMAGKIDALAGGLIVVVLMTAFAWPAVILVTAAVMTAVAYAAGGLLTQGGDR